MPKKTQKTYNQKPTRLAYYAYCVEFLSKIKKNKQEVFCTVALCCTIIKLMSIEDCWKVCSYCSFQLIDDGEENENLQCRISSRSKNCGYNIPKTKVV